MQFHQRRTASSRPPCCRPPPAKVCSWPSGVEAVSPQVESDRRGPSPQRGPGQGASQPGDASPAGEHADVAGERARRPAHCTPSGAHRGSFRGPGDARWSRKKPGQSSWTSTPRSTSRWAVRKPDSSTATTTRATPCRPTTQRRREQRKGRPDLLADWLPLRAARAWQGTVSSRLVVTLGPCAKLER